MTTLTVLELRQHLETDLTDEALGRLLEAEQSELERRYGADGVVTETLRGEGIWLTLSRPVASIVSITETIDEETVTLATNDWRVWGMRQLERMYGGTNYGEQWSPVVTVTYVPVDRSAIRNLMLIQLIKLDIAYEGMKSVGVGSGDWQMTAMEYNAERERLLQAAGAARGVGFV